MKLIIKQYLSGLREREELDAVLPDLLSQLGLNVISTPGRGTKQHGVDVAAVGKLQDEVEKVYLLSIKSGDLTRSEWGGNSDQALRQSIDEILDAYIPTFIPDEHKERDIVICLCFGGVIKEQVQASVRGYIDKNTTNKITFQEWNGDRIADLILSCFLREELLPKSAHSNLRKALALLDEPEVSVRYFRNLVISLFEVDKELEKLKGLRQVNLCLWILYSWAREINNLEAVYLASEMVVLRAWNITKKFIGKNNKTASNVFETYNSIIHTYLQIISEFADTRIFPYSDKKFCLSAAVHPANSLDVNLKMFDLLGRAAMPGVWALNALKIYQGLDNNDAEKEKQIWQTVEEISNNLKAIINSNSELLLPIKDSQVIDISLAVFLLLVDKRNFKFVESWFAEMLFRIEFSISTNGRYPCTYERYEDLLEHPDREREGYLKEATSGSVLLPMIALFAKIIGSNNLQEKVQKIKDKHLPHCAFQFWYPCEESEDHFYDNKKSHGAILYNITLGQSVEGFVNDALKECDESNSCDELTAMKSIYMALVFIACRHYRLPVPVHFFKALVDRWGENKEVER